MNREIAELLNVHTVIRRRDHPRLAGAFDWARAKGSIVSVLPGIYAVATLATDPRIRALAVCLADPDAVILGRAAARIQGWDEIKNTGAMIVASRRLHSRRWLHVTRRHIPPERIKRLGAIGVSEPALTAIDLAVDTEGSSIDNALRRRVPLSELHRALHERPCRRGRVATRRLLKESRDEPWSWAERKAHVLLRAARIRGWKSNVAVRGADGSAIGYADLAFEALGLAIEIDGAEWHLSPSSVLRDHARDCQFATRAWTVVRIPAAMVDDDPAGFIALVKALIAARKAVLRRAPR